MNIFSAKYKAHRLVNYIFYIIVFVFGFLVGLGVKKINFKTILPQILMIDKVDAASYDRYGDKVVSNFSFVPNSTNWFDSQFIYDLFNNVNQVYNTSYDISEYPFIVSFKSSGEQYYTFTFSKSVLNVDGTYMKINSSTSTEYLSIQVDLRNSNPSNRKYTFTHAYNFTNATPNSCSGCYNANTIAGTIDNTYSFTLTKIINIVTELVFDEDLFENDSNFKKVCLDEGNSFTITPSQGFYNNTGLYEDFIWFPYGLNGGLFKILYDNGSEYSNGNIISYPEEVMSKHFYFSSLEEINSFYDTDLPSDLEQAGYTDKYSYFGYDAYEFFIFYNNGTYRYPIFIWDNPSKTTISSSGIIHGGGGRRLDFDEDFDISTDYCFYIKNQYDVTIVQPNESGDFYGTVSSPDGDYYFSTTINSDNYQSNSKGYFSIVNDFISQIRSTINFINTQIYNFYLSMPLIVRTFILSVLTLFIVKLIINMIVR